MSPPSWSFAFVPLTNEAGLWGQRRSAVRAAALAAPGVAPLLDRDAGDEQADGWVEPPGAGDGVAEQPEQECAGEVGAEHVLPSLAGGGGGSEAHREALLGDAEERHEDERADGQADADPARV